MEIAKRLSERPREDMRKIRLDVPTHAGLSPEPYRGPSAQVFSASSSAQYVTCNSFSMKGITNPPLTPIPLGSPTAARSPSAMRNSLLREQPRRSIIQPLRRGDIRGCDQDRRRRRRRHHRHSRGTAFVARGAKDNWPDVSSTAPNQVLVRTPSSVVLDAGCNMRASSPAPQLQHLRQDHLSHRAGEAAGEFVGDASTDKRTRRTLREVFAGQYTASVEPAPVLIAVVALTAALVVLEGVAAGSHSMFHLVSTAVTLYGMARDEKYIQ